MLAPACVAGSPMLRGFADDVAAVGVRLAGAPTRLGRDLIP